MSTTDRKLKESQNGRYSRYWANLVDLLSQPSTKPRTLCGHFNKSTALFGVVYHDLTAQLQQIYGFRSFQFSRDGLHVPLDDTRSISSVKQQQLYDHFNESA